MLSLSTEYAGQSSAKNLQQDWLLELSYEDTVDGTFYFSGADREITNFYLGNVIDWGVIDESIDLKNSQSSISDVQITLANKYANGAGLLSAELFGGTKKFINQDVVIKSWIPNLALTDCLTIYKGRLVDIKHNLETVTLSIEKRSPWDRVKIGTVKTATGNYFPSVYGNYTPESSSATTPLYIDDAVVFPTKIDTVLNDAVYCLLHRQDAGTYNLHYYEKDLDQYCPFDPVNNAAGTYQGGSAITTAKSLRRSARFAPPSVGDGNEFLNVTYPASNAIDKNDATKAEEGQSISNSGIGDYDETVTEDLILDIPHIDGKLTALKLRVKWAISGTLSYSGSYSTAPSVGIEIYDYSYGTKTSMGSITLNVANLSDSDSGDAIYDITTKYTSANDTLPDKIKIRFETDLDAISDDAGSSLTTTSIGSVFEVAVIYDVQMDDSGEPQAVAEKIANMDRLYCGIDGYDQGWTDGSGSALYPHDIYRDMLYRYTGWDAADIDDVAVNDGVWTDDIDSDRNWPCRWWTLEQVGLLKILKQLQFEGGFIWVFDDTKATTGSLGSRVIYVKSSYSSTDFDIDYNDITNLDISMTPFSEIVTKRTFNFQRHPADEKRYLQTNFKLNDNRGDYNLEDEENAIEQDLDFLTASTDVDDLLTYYDSIVGEPKLLVKCDLLKPADWALQVGDIVNFENMVYEPYGKSWDTPIYFMCVRTNISPNKFTAYFREVG